MNCKSVTISDKCFFFFFSETAPICEGKWEYFSAVIYGLLAFPTELY